jgi:menaquinone-dependent protoporphyrinogen oxidase
MASKTSRTKTLALYSSVEGQTIKIINEIISNLEEDVILHDINSKQVVDLSQFDKVLIGASIRYGNLRKNMMAFMEKHQRELDNVPNAFFLVCLTARKPEKAVPENNAYMKKFDRLSPWQPQLKAVFAGALLYSRYNWWQTLLIQMIMKMTGGSTDTSLDIELTNWEDVQRFAKQFSAL